MTDSKGWKLRIRHGDTDKEIALAFTRTPLPGTEHIETVDDISMPELWSPTQVAVARGEREIKEFLNLVHQSQSS